MARNRPTDAGAPTDDEPRETDVSPDVPVDDDDDDDDDDRREQRRAAAEARANQFESDADDAAGSSSPDRDTTTPSRPEAAQESIADNQVNDVIDRFDEGADVLAGSADEAVGRAADAASEGDVAGITDALAGSTDEAAARAIDAVDRGDVAGAADAAAGGLDEATGQVAEGAGEVTDAVAEDIDNISREDLQNVAEDIARAEAANLQEGGLPGAPAGAVAGRAVADAIREADVDETVADELGQEGGFLSSEDEAALETAGRRLDQDINRAAEDIGDAVTSGSGDDPATPGSPADFETEIAGVEIDPVEDGETFVESGVEAGVRALGQAVNPFSLAASGETAAEASGNLPDAVDEGGSAAALGSGAAVSREVTEAAIESAQENPEDVLGETAVALGASTLGSAASFRGLARGGQAARNVGVRTRASETFTLDDLAGEREVETGAQPEFDTPTTAPTEDAIREFESEAGDQPDELLEGVGSDAAVMRSESERLPEDLETTRGVSELPGLFVSPELAPLRLDTDESGFSSGIDIRLPSRRDVDVIAGRTQRTSAFPGDRVEGIPDDAAESGVFGNDEEPPRDLAGVRFLDDEAERETVFVRPPGDRTPEFEGIFPPESEFTRTDTFAVDLPNNEVATLDVFERADDVDTSASLPGFGSATRGGLGDNVNRRPFDAFDPERVSPRRRRRSDGEAPATPATPLPGLGFDSSDSVGLGGDETASAALGFGSGSASGSDAFGGSGSSPLGSGDGSRSGSGTGSGSGSDPFGGSPSGGSPSGGSPTEPAPSGSSPTGGFSPSGPSGGASPSGGSPSGQPPSGFGSFGSPPPSGGSPSAPSSPSSAPPSPADTLGFGTPETTRRGDDSDRDEDGRGLDDALDLSDGLFASGIQSADDVLDES